ncbi:MAG: DUF2306 domain-containing protein [Chryseolinea sp.]
MRKVLSGQIAITVFLLASSLLFIYQYSHLFSFTAEALGKYFDVKWLLFGHIAPAACALLIGPFQFLKSIRNKNLKLHRLLGKLYMVCISISSLSALALTFITTNQVGKMYTISLWFLLLVWVVSTGMAYLSIRLRKIQEHEQWTVRSYIATSAFIVQNYILKVPALDTLGSFAEVSPNIFWFSWSIPLFAYQVYLTIIALNKRTART